MTTGEPPPAATRLPRFGRRDPADIRRPKRSVMFPGKATVPADVTVAPAPLGIAGRFSPGVPPVARRIHLALTCPARESPARSAGSLPRFGSRAVPAIPRRRRLRPSVAAAVVLLVAFGLPRLARSVLPDPLPILRPATIQPRASDGPQGMRVGAALLNAAAEVGGGYDSNLFAQSRVRAVGDAFRTEGLRARLDTNWRRDAAYAEAALEDRGYASRRSNDTTDVILGAGGRWDAARDVAFGAAYRHTRGHLSVSDPAAQILGALRPVPFDRDDALLSATWRPGNLILRAEATATAVRFGDAGGFSLAANDRDQAGLGLAAAWTFAPGNALTAALSGDAIRYTRAVSRGFDGEAWQGALGASWASDAVWRARASVGYVYRSFEGAGPKPLEGVAVDAALTWIPARETAVTLAARRGLDEVLSADPVPALRTIASLGVQHEATRDLTLQAALRFDRRDLVQPRRVAEDGVVAFGAEWRFTRNLALLGTYEHAVRLSGFAGLPNFNRDVVTLRLRGSL